MRLAERSDVLVESFRPGVADRLGIGYASVAARAPRIVYASISAFGQRGPYRDVASHDLAIEAMAGVLSITRGADGKPAMPGIPAADMLSRVRRAVGRADGAAAPRDTGRGDLPRPRDGGQPAPGDGQQPRRRDGRRRQPDVANARSLGGNALYALYETRDGAARRARRAGAQVRRRPV
jgi:hypothetical protein